MKQKLLNSIRAFWIAASDLYFALFFVWFGISMLTHGYFAWVSMMNMFAFQIFLFLIPWALAGMIYRVRRLQISSAIAVLLFLLVFAKFFLPKEQTVLASSDSLKVMTYNMLVYTPDPSAILDVIREENADIVFIQEISFAVADSLEAEVKDEYPYQIHFPSDIPLGLSVISKFPFEKIDFEIGEHWVGQPILLAVDWNGQIIHAVNFHMQPTSLGLIAKPELTRQVSEVRIDQAQHLVKFMQENPNPVIFAGDANEAFLNDPYRILVDPGLQDSWAEAGFGLGHSFPGNKSPGTSRLHVGELYIPEWMIRIDYIFASQEWQVLSAHMARTDGYSDHRGVVAYLRLK